MKTIHRHYQLKQILRSKAGGVTRLVRRQPLAGGSPKDFDRRAAELGGLVSQPSTNRRESGAPANPEVLCKSLRDSELWTSCGAEPERFGSIAEGMAQIGRELFASFSDHFAVPLGGLPEAAQLSAIRLCRPIPRVLDRRLGSR